MKKFLKAVQAYFMYQKPPKADYERLWLEEKRKRPIQANWVQELTNMDLANMRAQRRYKEALAYRKEHIKRDKKVLRDAIFESLFE